MAASEAPPTPLHIRVFYSADVIAERVESLAEEVRVSGALGPEPLVLIGLLRGAVPFIADFSRALAGREIPCSVDYLTVSSYGSGTKSNRRPEISGEISIDLEGRDVLVVDDILDSGHTLQHVLTHLETLSPGRLRVCTLLHKPARRETPVSADFVGFECPDLFVVGYGMDLDDRFRELPFIGVIEPD